MLSGYVSLALVTLFSNTPFRQLPCSKYLLCFEVMVVSQLAQSPSVSELFSQKLFSFYKQSIVLTDTCLPDADINGKEIVMFSYHGMFDFETTQAQFQATGKAQLDKHSHLKTHSVYGRSRKGNF